MRPSATLLDNNQVILQDIKEGWCASYQALQHALAGPLQGHGQTPPPQVPGQGLLGPLALGNDHGHQGGHLGATWPMGGEQDPQNSMAPRTLDYMRSLYYA